MKSCVLAAAVVAGTAGMALAQVQLQEIGRVDLRSFFDSTNPQGLGTNINGVAWNGTDLYVAGFKNTANGANTGILRVNAPLANGTTSTASFGGIATATSRGYTGLDINGNTLIAAWDNGANSASSFQAFDLAPGNALRWNNGTALGAAFRGFAGPSFNPGQNASGGLGSGPTWVVQGSGFERTLNETTGGANAFPSGFNNANVNTAGDASTAFRDIDYDPATGDIYIRVNNNVTRGVRTLQNQYNGGAGLSLIADLADQNQTATNIQFLDTSAFGSLLIFNNRASTANGQNFFTVTQVTSTLGAAQSVQFLSPSGTPFVPFGTGNAGYDYSFHSASQTLAISDFANNQVYIFRIPTPGAAVLMGMGALVAARRRR